MEHDTIIWLKTAKYITLVFVCIGTINCAVTMACHVIPASGRLVDVDIPELSESPWPGSNIF